MNVAALAREGQTPGRGMKTTNFELLKLQPLRPVGLEPMPVGVANPTIPHDDAVMHDPDPGVGPGLDVETFDHFHQAPANDRTAWDQVDPRGARRPEGSRGRPRGTGAPEVANVDPGSTRSPSKRRRRSVFPGGTADPDCPNVRENIVERGVVRPARLRRNTNEAGDGRGGGRDAGHAASLRVGPHGGSAGPFRLCDRRRGRRRVRPRQPLVSRRVQHGFLLEAGPPDRSPLLRIPAGVYKVSSNPKYAWQLETEQVFRARRTDRSRCLKARHLAGQPRSTG